MTKTDSARDRRLARLLELEPNIRKLAYRYRSRMADVGPYDADDLAQEIYTKAIAQLDRGFDPRWSFKSYVLRMARNHLISMARSNLSRKRRGILQTPVVDEVLCAQPSVAHDPDVARRIDLRQQTRELLAWLRANRNIFPWGWEVVQFMLVTEGNVNYTALALTMTTGEAWTVRLVRRTVEQISQTQRGGALRSTLFGTHQEA